MDIKSEQDAKTGQDASADVVTSFDNFFHKAAAWLKAQVTGDAQAVFAFGQHAELMALDELRACRSRIVALYDEVARALRAKGAEYDLDFHSLGGVIGLWVHNAVGDFELVEQKVQAAAEGELKAARDRVATVLSRIEEEIRLHGWN